MTKPDAAAGKARAMRKGDQLALLRCPFCSSTLQAGEGKAVCVGCARRYPIVDGIVDLRLVVAGAVATGLGGDLPKIEVFTPAGWVDAVRNFLAGRDDSPEMLDALVAGRHQVWRGFLELQSDSRVLCIGSGYGSFLEALAPRCARAFVLEPDIEKLRFVLQRLAVFGADDAVVPVAGGVAVRLPFSDGAFDAVVMAEPEVCGAPGPLLGEVRRILRDSGQLLLIADNRFSLALPNGWWDRWASAPKPLRGLTRGCAMLARWWQKGGGAQSLPTLRRQLRASHFSDLEELGLWPTRRQFEEIVPLRGGRYLAMPGDARSWQRRLRRHGFFLPAHTLTVQAGGPRRQSSYERILEAVAKEMSAGEGTVPLHAKRYIMTRKDKMVVLIGRGPEDLVLRIPISPVAECAEGRHAATIARLPSSLRSVAPEPIAAGRIDGITYHVEKALPGLPLKRLLHKVAAPRLFEQAEGLLERLNPTASLSHAQFTGARYERLVQERLDRLFQVLPEQALRNRLTSFLQTQLHGATLPFGLVHGDFSVSNIYLSREQAGIIDWEAADMEDLPVLDAITYLESWLRPFGRRHSLAERVRSFALRNFPTVTEERFLCSQYERLGVEPARHAGLVYLSWLRHLDFLLPYWLHYHPGEQRRYVHDVVNLLPAARELH